MLDDLRVGDRGSIQRNLVGAGAKNAANVVERSNAAANRERNEYLSGSPLHNIEEAVALVQTRYNIHVDEFVRTLIVIMARKLLRLAQYPQTFKVNAFH